MTAISASRNLFVPALSWKVGQMDTPSASPISHVWSGKYGEGGIGWMTAADALPREVNVTYPESSLDRNGKPLKIGGLIV